MAGLLDSVVDYVASEPILVGLVVVMLAFVFFIYLLVRRTLLGVKEGYESGYRK